MAMKKILIALALAAAVSGFLVWWTLYRVVPQPAWISETPLHRYYYGSIGAGEAEGIPYWVWLALPRMFPEYMPATGGYAALGLSWEEGREMPVGFAKQRIGYIRVTGNCALCHAISGPPPFPRGVPSVIPSQRGRTTDLEPLLTFLKKCADDPRFTSGDIFGQVDQATKLSALDRLLYRCVLIPRTRTMLLRDPEKVLFSPEILEHIHDPKKVRPSRPLPR
jgi:hypothetical protein